jgi:uncharacterized membrane protein
MHDLLLSLHILVAVFAIGPLVHAATTASRGVKAADATAIASSVRTISLYTYISIAVGVLGMGMVQDKWRAHFGDTWVWLSIILYLLMLALSLGLLLPTLRKAATTLAGGGAISSFTGRVAASGGVIALLVAVIVFLMVYRPGQPGR